MYKRKEKSHILNLIGTKAPTLYRSPKEEIILKGLTNDDDLTSQYAQFKYRSEIEAAFCHRGLKEQRMSKIVPLAAWERNLDSRL